MDSSSPEDLRERIVRLQAENKRLAHQIDILSHDADFGILTRNAFTELCRYMPRGVRVFAFLDFDHLKELNASYGYSEVNRRIRETLSIPHRKSDVIARWFSGDEVVILFDTDNKGARMKMAEFEKAARANGLSFTYELGTWVVGSENVADAIQRVGDRVLLRKAEARRES